MQSYKFQEIIDRACEKNKIDKDLMKSFSDFIWKETKTEMSRFSNLRIYLSGFIAWYYGLSRLKVLKGKIDMKKESRIKEVKNKDKVGFLEGLNEEELNLVSDKVDNLLDRYEIYIEDKNTTKAKYREEMKILVAQRLNKLNEEI